MDISPTAQYDNVGCVTLDLNFEFVDISAFSKPQYDDRVIIARKGKVCATKSAPYVIASRQSRRGNPYSRRKALNE